MAITTYSELQTAVADWLNRTDLTSKIPDFIALAEADLKVRAKLTEWDTSAAVTLTSGVGTLPTDFLQAITVTYSGVYTTLKFMNLERFTEIATSADVSNPVYYTISGSSLNVYPLATGDATLLYRARFTSLSTGSPTNSLLTMFPDVYLQGAIFQACVYLRDDPLAGSSKTLYEEAVERVRKYTYERRYGAAPLQMRVA